MKLTFLVLCITAVASGRMLTMPRPIGIPVREIVYMTTETSTTPPPLDAAVEVTNPVQFFNHALSILGTKDAQELANDLKGEFENLDTLGTLGTTLISLFELRLEDLHVTIDHYKKMKTVLDLLTANH